METNLDYFTEHDPIAISSNQDLEDFSTAGSGTLENPYIIEKLFIESTGVMNSAIEVRGTTSHFIIRNCHLVSDYIGILIDDVWDRTALIVNNTCVSSSGDGGGIGISNSDNCTITENRCSNFMQGIHLNGARGCFITDNNITDNNYQGINIRHSSWNTITGNIIENSTQHGLVFVVSANNNVAYQNRFIDNGNVETYVIDGEREGVLESQGYDEGNDNVWYDAASKVGNFWSDYSGEAAYSIDGPSDAQDLYPNGSQGNSEPIGLEVVQIVAIVIIVGSLAGVLAWRFLLRSKRS